MLSQLLNNSVRNPNFEYHKKIPQTLASEAGTPLNK
jgi:hypothetical protein